MTLLIAWLLMHLMGVTGFLPYFALVLLWLAHLAYHSKK